MIEKIDFKAIIAEAASEVSEMSLVHGRRGFFNKYSTRIVVTPDLAQHELLKKVWGKCVELLNKQQVEAEPLVVEKALSILLKRGIAKEKISCKKNSFRMQLANGQYRAYKTSTEGNIWACPWPSEKRYTLKISGSAFADFLLQFDAKIPEMLSHLPAILDTLRTREREEQRELIAAELKNNLVSTLIDQYLNPLGLSVKYNVRSDDMVSLDISQVLSARLEFPLEQLQEKIKDTGAILAALKVAPPSKESPYDTEIFTL